MNNKFTAAITLAITVAVSCLFSISAHAELQATHIEAGVFYRPDLTLKPGETLLAAGKQETITPTREIPAKLGTKFGVRFQLLNKDTRKPNTVTMLYLTPGVVDNKGQRHDRYQVMSELSATAKDHVMAFEITEAYEQKPGIWEFMVFDGDRLLVREKFKLLPAQ
jgi:hypothetical protein